MNESLTEQFFQNPKKRRFSSDHRKMKVISSLIEELTQLCHTVDPYSGVTQKQQESLKKFGILDFSDPFALTNQLILLLEDHIEERERLLKKLGDQNNTELQ